MSGSLTDVPGIRVGHAGDDDARTGCTVILGPFRAAADIRGSATGTREIEVISPRHLVDRADAILLTGGSAFGLAAADGVMAWLEEQGGFGFESGAGRVPIVPAAVLFDLAVGRSDRRPDAAMGRRACESAEVEVAEGRVGAGTGARVGIGLGPDRSMPGGVGTASVSASGHTVGALAIVNSMGDVLDGVGRIIAGARAEDGTFADSSRIARESGSRGANGLSGAGGPMTPPGTATTLCVVSTDAPLDRSALQALARAGSTGVARRIAPAHTPFDGDVTFAVSPTSEIERVPPELMLALGTMAAEAVAEALERAVQ